MTAEDVARARGILDRLKRGVPPTEGLDELSVGMTRLYSRVDALLSADAKPRWFAVLSEYGEGKSHFQLVAQQRALRAGYAVASLTVNKDEGALHQPQRHLATLLGSLRSPIPEYDHHVGLTG